jgi:hypothetical protein
VADAEALPFTFEVDDAWVKVKNPETISRVEYRIGKSLMRIKSKPTGNEKLTQREVNEMNNQIVAKAPSQLIVVNGINGIYTRMSKTRFFRSTYKINCRFIHNKIEYFFILDYKGRGKHFDAAETQFITLLNTIKWP